MKLNKFNFIHGIDYYGSFLGIKNNYKYDITDDLDYLENNNFEFWNLGHSHMEYKQRLGCKTYSRSDFLKRWDKAVIG